MDAELKAKWVTALRSGEYKQGQEVLRQASDRFCCLGVLCDISGAGEWVPSGDGFVFVADGRRFGAYAPPSMGIGAADTLLTEMNDGGDSFAEIADYIESHL